MLLSGSIYSWDSFQPTDAALKLESIGVDCLHVDCCDDPSVFDDIRAIKSCSKVPIDLHLITERPKNYFDAIRRSKLEICCFQYESLKAPLVVPDDLGCRLGLAVTMDTPIDVFEPFEDRFSFILLMTTVPGMSGGSFNPRVFQRIREFRKKFPSKSIHVDGGVTDDVSLMLKNHGVNLVVVGSYLKNTESIVNATLLIRGQAAEKSNYLIRDFMHFPEEFPVLNYEDLSIQSLLVEMSSKHSGFAAVVDGDFKLCGIITDGDIRRSWLHVIETGHDIDVRKMLNLSPQTISETATVGDMLQQISVQQQTRLYLPVVGDGNKLCGAISFQDLIRGGI